MLRNSSPSSPRRASNTARPFQRTPPAKKRRTATTPVMRTPPAKKQRQGDKYELSPNSLAKCTTCRKKINQGETRIGKETFEPRYSNFVHRYYHDQCFPAALKQQLKLQAATPEDELIRADKEKRKQDSIVNGERRELFEALKTLRRGFARALHCENQLFRVFTNKTLEEMTIKMPKNQRDMIDNVHGIGPSKYESFGEAFLQVIQHYARKYARAQNESLASTGTSIISSSSGPALVISTAGTDTAQADDVVPLESLSCSEIIQLKFEHAAANGYLISLD
jgi:superfamily II DNA helicase RecQ